MRRIALGIALLVGCAATEPALELEGPQDAPESAVGDSKADGASCSLAKCGDPAAETIVFPGNLACGSGCERTLASESIYIPPRNGKPWGDTYMLGTDEPVSLAGYSSGRIALLRRLALIGDGTNAILIDPSWEDGERDFAGRGPERGADIVRDWLLADESRTFVILYSTRSTGWASYVALADSDVSAQVKVCTVNVPHYLVPKVEGLADALIDPIWNDAGACRWGGE